VTIVVDPTWPGMTSYTHWRDGAGHTGCSTHTFSRVTIVVDPTCPGTTSYTHVVVGQHATGQHACCGRNAGAQYVCSCCGCG
jgi:hypothetical protein